MVPSVSEDALASAAQCRSVHVTVAAAVGAIVAGPRNNAFDLQSMPPTVGPLTTVAVPDGAPLTHAILLRLPFEVAKYRNPPSRNAPPLIAGNVDEAMMRVASRTPL